LTAVWIGRLVLTNIHSLLPNLVWANCGPSCSLTLVCKPCNSHKATVGDFKDVSGCNFLTVEAPSTWKAGVSNTLPAMLFGNFQIINIYVAKCFEKRCSEIIASKLNDAQCGFRSGRSITDQISALRSNFL